MKDPKFLVFKFFKKFRVKVDDFFEKYFSFFGGRIKINLADFVLFAGFLFVLIYCYVKLNVNFLDYI